MASNCTKEEYQKRVKELHALRARASGEVSSIPPLLLVTDCIYANDTKEINPNCKCRGTKIICNNKNLAGFINYSKYCNKYNCKYYEEKSII